MADIPFVDDIEKNSAIIKELMTKIKGERVFRQTQELMKMINNTTDVNEIKNLTQKIMQIKNV
jgi:hypothetical protein